MYQLVDEMMLTNYQASMLLNLDNGFPNSI